MLCSVISAKGMGCLYIVEGTTKQDQYKLVLEAQLPVNEWFPDDEKCVFMYDSALCHKASGITAFLTEKDVTVLPWKGNSLHMNPTENMF